jgi:WD40 repeat protein
VAEHPANARLKDISSYAAVWDLRSPGKQPVTFSFGLGVQPTVLSPDGHTMYRGWPLTAYDVETGKPKWSRDREVYSFSVLELSRDGTVLVGEFHDGVKDNTMVVVDARTGREIARLGEHGGQPRGAAFSHDGRLFASVSDDGEAIVWDVADWKPRHRWRTFEQGYGIDFSRDDRLLYTDGDDGVLRTWDLAAQDTLLRRTATAQGSPVFVHADVSPDGSRVAYRWLDDEDGWIRFVVAASGAATAPQPLEVTESSEVPGAWSPDGSRYATYDGCWAVCDDVAAVGTVGLFDVATGKAPVNRRVAASEISSLAFVDDRSLLAGEADGKTTLLDAQTLRSTGVPRNTPSDCCLAVTPDGLAALLLEGSGDGASEHWRVVDVAGNTVRKEGELAMNAHDADFSPDGSRVAVAGQTGELVIIDPATGDTKPGSAGLGTDPARAVRRRRHAAGHRLARRRGQPLGCAEPAADRHPAPAPRRRAGTRGRGLCQGQS